MRRAVGTVLLALALGLLAGCTARSHGPGIATAGGGHGDPSASPSASVDPEEQARRFAECMRAHGVDVPDPDSGGGPGGGAVRIQGSPGTNADAAIRACQQYLPAGNLGTPNAQQIEQARQFAQCMRDHGVDMPDPDPNGGGAIIQKNTTGGQGVNPDDPNFKAALQACQDKLPGKISVNGGGGGDGPGTTTGGGK